MTASPRNVHHAELLAQMGWVRNLARGLVGDPDRAEDVAQDALALALERPPRAVRGPSLRAWLARVTRTLARQGARSDGRRRVRERRAARGESLPSTADVVERGALQRRIADAVMELDEPYRSAILYRYLDGLSAPEIAARTGASPAAVRKRISRGLERLRERFDGEHGKDGRSWLQALAPLAATWPDPSRSAPGPLLGGAAVVSTPVKIAAGLAIAAGALWMLRSPASEADASRGVEPPVAEVVAAGGTAGETAGAPPLAAPGGARAARGAREPTGGEDPVGDLAERATAAAAGHALAGRVVDERGEPIEGALVCAIRPVLSASNAELMSLWGPGVSLRGDSVRTAADGSFSISGIEPGPRRVWAGLPPLGWAHSETLLVGAAAPPEPLELVLVELPLGNRVEGRVLDPHGVPLAGAVLEGSEREGFFVQWGTSADDGTFVLPVLAGRGFDLRARDLSGTHGPVTVEDVAPGTLDLVVRMRVPRLLEVVVTDQDGAPLEEVRLGFTCDGQHFPIQTVGGGEGEGDLLVLPDTPFEIQVWADGYAREELGPLEPAAAPERLEVALRRLARVRGRLTAGGEPVRKGVVQLVRLAGPERVDHLYGFPSRLDGRSLAGDYTDEDGRFSLPIGERGEFALFAEAEGWAAAEQSPLSLDPAREERIDLELTEGGAIEGRVLVPPGEEPGTLVVQASRGDMRFRQAVLDGEGHYRLEGLTPGPWMVHARRRARAVPGATRGLASPIVTQEVEQAFVFDWDCEVREGETTWFDLRLEAETMTAVRGRVSVDGAPPLAGRARLSAAENRWHHDLPHLVTATALDGEGAFHFVEIANGEHWLVVTLSGKPLDQALLLRRLALEGGEATFELALETAELVFAPATPGTWAAVTELGEARVVRPLEEGADGGPLPAVVAAGHVRVVRYEEGLPREDPLSWRTAVELEVAPGSTQRVDLSDR